MEIPKKINDEIWDYCRANSISNIDNFMLKLLQQGFTVEKYGSTPMKSKIIEKIVEIPVEKIVEVPINVDNSVLNEKYNLLLKDYESLKNELDILKKNNKKDIYGE